MFIHMEKYSNYSCTQVYDCTCDGFAQFVFTLACVNNTKKMFEGGLFGK